jgi:murein DD-endopeptidase MepM/ murein hydrolase activator NlpD
VTQTSIPRAWSRWLLAVTLPLFVLQDPIEHPATPAPISAPRGYPDAYGKYQSNGLQPAFEWPTNAGRAITSTFGEFRESHFHLGLDIGTHDSVGYEVYAAREGYVSRILISPTGYGKLLHVRHPDGHTSVYAHLYGFIPRLASRAKAEQLKLQRYRVDIRPAAHEYPVRKGDLIAYTGETGTGTPHLHFEVRDENFAGINPQRFDGLVVDDTIPPSIRSIALIPLAEESRVSGTWDRRVFTPRRNAEGVYRVADTIGVTGRVGIAVNARDRSNGSQFEHGLYRVLLQMEGMELLTITADQMPGAGGNQIMSTYDFSLMNAGEGRFLNLFVASPHRLPIYSPSGVGSGVLDFRNLGVKPRQIRILLEDFKRNTTTLECTLQQSTMPIPIEDMPQNGNSHGDFSSGWSHEGDLIKIYASIPGKPDRDPEADVSEGSTKRLVSMTGVGRAMYVGVFRPLEKVAGTRKVAITCISKSRQLKSDFTFDLYPIVPTESRTYAFDGDNFIVHFNRGAVYKTIFLHVKRVTENASSVYLVSPRYSVLDEGLRISIRKPQRGSRMAIFMRTSKEWSLTATSARTRPGYFTAVLHRTLGDVAVIADTTAPQIRDLSISAKAGKETAISFGIRDDLAGVEYDHVKTYIDGVFVIPEIDGEHRKVSLLTSDPVAAGPHRLMIRLADKLGNVGIVERRFVAR